MSHRKHKTPKAPPPMHMYDRRQQMTKLLKNPVWEVCAFRNYRKIEQDCWHLPYHPCLSTLKDAEKGKPCIILGSGASLDNAGPYLKHWKGVLFAGATTTQVAAYHGRTPDYIVVIDSLNKPEQLNWQHIDYAKTRLICPPTINPEIVWGWPHERYYFLSGNPEKVDDPDMADPKLTWGEFVAKYRPKAWEPADKWLRDEHRMFFKRTLRNVFSLNPLMKKGIKMFIQHASCVPNASAYIAAHILGCDPILTVGVDNGFVRDKTRCSAWNLTDAGWQENIAPYTEEGQKYGNEPVFRHDGLLTTDQFWGYSRSLIMTTISGPNHLNIIECAANGERGISKFFPYIDIQEAVTWPEISFDHLKRPPLQRVQLAQEYLSSQPNSLREPDIGK